MFSRFIKFASIAANAAALSSAIAPAHAAASRQRPPLGGASPR
jgi:hypothetical protein